VGASVGGTACRTNCESEAEGCINDASGQAVGMSSRLSRLSFVSSSLYNRHDQLETCVRSQCHVLYWVYNVHSNHRM
jgi:hypothetical protein